MTYADMAPVYWAAGWRGILPLPAGQKSPPPDGWTGAGAPEPSYADMLEWAGMWPGANIALRLPDGIIGIDVDNYQGKCGGRTLLTLCERYGPLPETYMSSARDDGVSGIRLYTTPEGLRWPGQAGADIEIIQRRHRYMVVSDSVHPDGMVYGWTLNGDVTGIPSPGGLAELPRAWVDGLTRGESVLDVARLPASGAIVTAWLDSLPSGAACPAVARALARALDLLRSAGSRHESGLRRSMHLCRLGAEGHLGVVGALHVLRDAWLTAVTGDGSRSGDAAAREWDRMLTGAVSIALDTPGMVPADPCLTPWAGIMPPEAPQGAAEAPAGARADDGSTIDPGAVRAAMVAAEVERLEIRREAARLLDTREALAAWREPPSWDLPGLLAQPDEPLRYTVESVMPEGSNVLLTAQFKAGKTTMVSHLAACLADGGKFLGAFPVMAGEGRIALWNYEVGAAQYATWLRRLSVRDSNKIVGINLRGFTLPLIVPALEDWAVKWLSEREVTHWIIDPWGRAIVGTDENSNSEVGRWLDTLDNIKERAGVANLILPTHTGRGEQEQGAERARGATRIDDWADVRWILTVQDGDRFFRAHGRDVDVPEGRLSFDPLMGSLVFDDGSQRAPATEGKRSRRSREGNLYDEIIVAVGLNPGLSARALARVIGRRGEAVRTGLALLSQQGKVITTGTGPASGWWLPGVTDTGEES